MPQELQKQKLESLIAKIGKGNLLEALFTFLGGFQNMISLHWNGLGIDHRNFFNFYNFVSKKQMQPLDRYFKLKLSLQGMCLIYEKAHKILSQNNNLSAQEVMDEIYGFVAINQELTKIVDIVEQEEDKSIKLLNMLVSPKGKVLFNNTDDFEVKVLKDIRKLLIKETEPEDRLNEIITNGIQVSKCDKDSTIKEELYKNDISLYRLLINLYRQVHNSKIDADMILALIDDIDLYQEISGLVSCLHLIKISGEDYTFDNDYLDQRSKGIKEIYANEDLIPIGISGDNLTYLISSNDEDLNEKFEDNIISSIKHSDNKKLVNGSKPQNGTLVLPKIPPEKVKKILLYTIALLSVAFAISLSFPVLEKPLYSDQKKGNFILLAVLSAVIIILGTATLALFYSPKANELSEPLKNLTSVDDITQVTKSLSAH